MSGRPPVLIYDADCGFCERWARRFRRLAGQGLTIEPSSQALLRRPDVDPRRFREAVALEDGDGALTWAAEAAFQALALNPALAWPLACYRHVPGFAWVSEAAYRWVARRRKTFSAGACVLAPADLGRSYTLSRWLFLRGLALVYLIAFVSLDVQLNGLVGSHGLLPAAAFVARLRAQWGPLAWTLLPSLAWFNGGDTALHLMACGGALLALLGLGPKPAFAALWLLYLSLCGVGQDFLGFQWDNLLLEAGLLAVFAAPWALFDGPRRPRAPTALQVFGYRWLLFRLMLGSGLVKLSSGDPTWASLTALFYHYQTQPLPTWVAWYAQQLPDWVQRWSCVGVFGVELGLPWLIFLGPRPRRLALAGFLLLQALIALTGNYGFFNLLSALLCLWLADDALYPRAWSTRLLDSRRLLPEPPRPQWLLAAWLLLAVPIGAAQVLGAADRWPGLPALDAVVSALRPWRSLNPYGLFAEMTTRRPELVLEGSDDGRTWKEYGWRWKPGDPRRRPAFVEPYLPRLDWQLWFAALGPPQDSPWTLALLVRVLQGDPALLGLLGNDPFPGRPPRYAQLRLYDYRFSLPAERAATGDWWLRRDEGVWLGPLRLDQALDLPLKVTLRGIQKVGPLAEAKPRPSPLMVEPASMTKSPPTERTTLPWMVRTAPLERCTAV